jgi:hypothetical protein
MCLMQQRAVDAARPTRMRQQDSSINGVFNVSNGCMRIAIVS